MYRALGGEPVEEPLICPHCKKETESDSLGYCKLCKFDLSRLLKERNEE
jgi:hypothetical protein